ncbi:ricin-type beta-trefoil lectin domain protein [Vibrio pectenicida]|uniref:Ricin-type beta-trefoil lectin domain protein n=1 Tax=Vibrio pectenicida TaxID=62763 RepID=A0A7Y4ED08_9VIBR|nr:RICIN domain-containing protein [Vibrio pectenicida]NOH69981.1 ricin-type beta-trefoil lectin domain protein [Vibrio pectenicida]
MMTKYSSRLFLLVVLVFFTHIVRAEDNTTTLDIDRCTLFGYETKYPARCKYYFLDLANISINEREDFTNKVIGIGFSSPYTLITSPKDVVRRQIYIMEERELDYITKVISDDHNIHNKSNKSSIDVGSVPNVNNSQIIEFAFHRRFTIGREGKGNTNLKFKVRYYRKSPYFYKFGDKDKFVEIILDEGAGLNMGDEEDIYASWKKNSHTSYVYREYIDSTSIGINVNESERLENGDIYLNDLEPKMQDQTDTRIEKETTSSIKLGLGLAPKLPIQNIEYRLTNKYQINSSKQFGLKTEAHKNGYQLKYLNNTYGSHKEPEAGFCSLGTADGWCWDWATSEDQPWNFSKLRDRNPLSLQGLRPDFVAKIAAKPQVSGFSTISIHSKVNTLSLFGQNRMFLGRRYIISNELFSSGNNSNWRKDRNYEKHEYADEFTILVDWDSPWFLGSDAVTIKSVYLSQDNAMCLTAEANHQLSFRECVEGSKAQAFVYDQEKRYRSVANLNHCLDSSNQQLKLSDECNDDYASNTQVWYWEEPDRFTNDVLFTINSDQSISLIDASTNQPKILKVGYDESKPNGTQFTSRFADFGMATCLCSSIE